VECGGLTVDPRRVAEIFRDRDHPDWQKAYEYVLRIFVKLVSRPRLWPRVRALGEEYQHVNTVAQELTGEFWMFLVARPKVLDAAKVLGPGVLWRQAQRFLDMYPTDIPPELAEPRLKKHLYEKVEDVLKSHGDFVNWELPEKKHQSKKKKSPLWGLVGFPAASATAHDLSRANAKQRELPADWKPQRGGQRPSDSDDLQNDAESSTESESSSSLPRLPGQTNEHTKGQQTPPIATPQDLKQHLVHILTIAGRYCQVGDLRDLCWAALRPANAGFVHPDSITEEAGDPFITSLLREHLGALASEERLVLRLTLGGFGVRAIERETDLPHTTIARKLKEVREGLLALLRENGYKTFVEADQRFLDLVLWDILNS
jgi:hypothetical protein